jgi:aminoglycoside phosphotransferase (APT) family kinase protein
LTDARTLVPRIIASDSAARAACGPRTVIARAELTSTDVVVVIVAPPGGPSCAVFKLPVTARAVDGVEREGRALTALHGDERLRDWRRLIPLPRASGALDGRRYRVDTVLRGRTVLDQLGDDSTRRRLLESAAETIHVLHRASATAVEVDDRLAERWIDAPADDLLAHGAARGLEPRLHRLREELRAAVMGRRVSAGWIHGDYWLGNLLFEASEPRPRGIVDWDAAAETQLPMIDVLHLLLSTRWLTTGRDLGDLVLEQLRGGGWPGEERPVLDRYGTWCHEGSLSERQLLLMYWLRHVAHHARQQGSDGGLRYRRWQKRNVRPILAWL